MASSNRLKCSVTSNKVAYMNRPSKSAIELDAAKSLMRWITHEDLDPIDKPDCSRPSRRGGNPDFVFEDSKKNKYVLELTRLLTPELRGLENTVAVKVCTPVEYLIPGTYILHIHLTDPLGRGKVALKVLKQTEEEILRILKDGTLKDSQQLSVGFVLRKVKSEGNKLVPWITSPQLRFDLTDAHPIAKELRSAFEELIKEADLKFRGYDPHRLLLIATSQSGLDLGFHAGKSKDGKGILLTWMDTLYHRILNIDAIFLEPGINVRSWGGKVMAGHKYIESKAGYYPELWRRSGIPSLLI
jgi:hypothetical protein